MVDPSPVGKQVDIPRQVTSFMRDAPHTGNNRSRTISVSALTHYFNQ